MSLKPIFPLHEPCVGLIDALATLVEDPVTVLILEVDLRLFSP